VLPLSKKEPLLEVARRVYDDLRRRGIRSDHDVAGAIGKRYRRQDEIGTPFAVTVDHQSLEDRTVTLRHRDSLEQERVAIDDVLGRVQAALD